ncbi:UNVERIFIED_ORG: hypothetical protein M2348_002028 [Sphingomonas sp. R1F5B]
MFKTLVKTGRNTGHALRMIGAFGSAILWGVSAWQLQDAGPDAGAFGVGQSAVIGVWALAAASALGGLISLRRLMQPAQTRPRATAAPGLEDLPAKSDFDPDAIIARHLAQRASAPPPPIEDDAAQPAPPRPVFGRKGIGSPR